jgi:hypothetical protein
MLCHDTHQRVGKISHKSYWPATQTSNVGTRRRQRPSVKANEVILLYLATEMALTDGRYAKHG